MSDDNKDKLDGKDDDQKHKSDDELKKVIAQRDEAKKKARELEEQIKAREEADKKQSEQKAIEEGKIKEILAQKEKELETERGLKAQLEAKAKAFEDSQNKLREQALAKITDPKMKEIAGKLPSVEDVIALAELEGKKKTYNQNHPTGGDNLPRGATGAKTPQEYLRKAQEMGMAN